VANQERLSDQRGLTRRFWLPEYTAAWADRHLVVNAILVFAISYYRISDDLDSTDSRIRIIQNGPFPSDARMLGPTDTPAAAVEEARRHYRLRRIRDQEFGPTLFGEPAWDLLLDLYIAASDPRLVSVMSASIAASVSTQDTARWLTRLEEQGLVERFYSGADMSQAIVTLSQSAFDQMTRLLNERP
jgi:hypothetical protein